MPFPGEGSPLDEQILPSSTTAPQEPDAALELRVLIVAGDALLAQALRENLAAHGFDTLVAHSAAEVWEVLWASSPHLIVLDITLPEGEEAGFSLAQDLREAAYPQPILFLTPQGVSPNSVPEGKPGTDYLEKPFGTAELVARLRVLHGRDEPKPHAVRWGSFELLTEARQLRHEGVLVRLTAKEHEVLELFMLTPGRVFSREEVIERAWGGRYETPLELVDLYVKTLRGKLTDAVIETVNGLGYRFSG